MKSYRIRVCLISLILFCLSIGIFLTGYLSTGTRKNYFSIVSAVGILPAAKFAVYFIMASRFKLLSFEEYEQLKEGSELQLYDLYLTGNEMSIMINACICSNDRILILTKDQKLNLENAIEFLNRKLENEAGIRTCDIRIFHQPAEYISEIRAVKKSNPKLEGFFLSASL